MTQARSTKLLVPKLFILLSLRVKMKDQVISFSDTFVIIKMTQNIIKI